MADAATVTMTATIMPDEIVKALDSKQISYTPANSSEGWYYKITNLTNTSTDLISGNFLHMSTIGHDVGSAPAAISTSDKVKFLWIENRAVTDDGSTASSDSAFIVLDAGTAAYNTTDAIEIQAGDFWCATLNVTVADIHAIAAQTGGTSSAKLQCIVAAIIDDV